MEAKSVNSSPSPFYNIKEKEHVPQYIKHIDIITLFSKRDVARTVKETEQNPVSFWCMVDKILSKGIQDPLFHCGFRANRSNINIILNVYRHFVFQPPPGQLYRELIATIMETGEFQQLHVNFSLKKTYSCINVH